MWNRLFNSIQIIPKGSLQERFMSIIRLILLCGIILWLFNMTYSIIFVLFAILLVTIIYENQKKKEEKENYEPTDEWIITDDFRIQ